MRKKKTLFTLDMRGGFCECKEGNNCGPCKHKAAIIFLNSVFCVLSESDQNIRGLYHYIADGIVCANFWYRDLDKPEHETDVHNFVETRTNKIGDHGMNIGVTNIGENTSEIEVEEGHFSNHEESSDEDVKNDILDNFEKAMDLFKEKVVTSYNKTLGKGVDHYLTKKLLKFSKQTGSTFEIFLFSIGKEIVRPKTGGKRKKNDKLIPVQVTAKKQRHHKHRLRVVGKDQNARMQMIVSEDKTS